MSFLFLNKIGVKTLKRVNFKSILNYSTEKTPIHSNILTDKFNRKHEYLRISLTERCNLRCTYCMPEEGVPLTPKQNLLTTQEILKLANMFVSQGITKIRLTGGEPTLRPDLVDLIGGLNELRPLGLNSIAMTSNGISLKRKLPDLINNGLQVLNLSLDTLNSDKFIQLTRRNGLSAVLSCIDTAYDLNIPTLKINCVIMSGVNDDEVIDFINLTKNRNIIVRFIEYMPFTGNKWSSKKLVPYKTLIEKIEQNLGECVKVKDGNNDTTKHYKINGYMGSFGFISSMTDHFCNTCNRLRITADGNLKVCLFGNVEVSLRDMLRSNCKMEDMLTMVEVAVKNKKEKHAGMHQINISDNRPMVLIGG